MGYGIFWGRGTWSAGSHPTSALPQGILVHHCHCPTLPCSNAAKQTGKPRLLISVYSLWPSTQSHSYSFKLPPFSSSLVDFFSPSDPFQDSVSGLHICLKSSVARMVAMLKASQLFSCFQKPQSLHTLVHSTPNTASR